MNWILVLQELLPVLGGLTGHPELSALAARFIDIGEAEVARRMAETGQTRAEVLADADTTFQAAIQGADDLKDLP